ncbi:MAG: hypothetical protein COV74_04980 [Candidatus Omnitrophica bacterium CG11_big_fil_rev_8_21_14_0_20_45_26]|uniref:HTH cro/C1-type domain-containing protein n=1 Tax=Candidatus Abzuiibacterium crystallinum TaxID=1974748 RepID=A0A2H0LPZ4_9BACT|nr:MAG: hypothetical protein COV74_04980 [Candidatus Omnitrophica bacterium CG11_big_fil_rev_8_21_14_0_20_45_26]PIW63615.1 MAG: hypothetical protein COW12_09895 [Candidatus Omnitrophica bacterium CG12_big_fil_rev_8_21_14_0_65_45_16]
MGKFAKYLEKRLEEKNVTKAELARKIGLKRQNYINNIVAGLHTPTIKRVEQIAKALDCNHLERLELIRLAAEERTPDELKKHSSVQRLRFCYQVSDVDQLSNLSALRESKFLNEYLLDSYVFKIDTDFFAPLIKKGQRAIMSLQAPVEIGDAGFFQILGETEEDRKKLRAFKDPFPVSEKGYTGVVGILVGGNVRSPYESEIEIRHLQHPGRVLKVSSARFGSIVKIMGILF